MMLLRRLSWKEFCQITRYVVSGIGNTLTDFILFNLLIMIFPSSNPWYVIGYSVCGFAAANLQSFWVNSRWTFRKPGDSVKGWDRYWLYLMVSIMGLLISSVTFYVLQHVMGPTKGFRWIGNPIILLNLLKLTASLIGIMWNYLGYRMILLNKSADINTLAMDAVHLQVENDTKLPEISLIIPVYNESQRLKPAMDKLVSFSEMNPDVELVFIDDGSTDCTSQIIQSYYTKITRINHYRFRHNWGKGGAVRFGMHVSRGETVCFMDADLSFSLRQISSFHALLQKGADVVIGSRQEQERNPLYRKITSTAFHSFVRILGLTSVRDTQCGMKAFKKNTVLQLLPETKCTSFAFDVEWMALAERYHMDIHEVPVNWVHRDGSTVRWIHLLQMAVSLLHIRLRLFLRFERERFSPIFAREVSISLGLFAVALAIRLPFLYTVPHFIDEWREVSLASQIAKGEAWPLHNVAHDIGAFYNYVLAGLFIMFGQSLWVPRLFIAVIGSGTVVLTYWVARCWLDFKGSLLAAFMLAANSMYILTTHKAWSNDTTPFFIMLAVLLSLKAFDSQSRLKWGISGLAWAIALQTHSSVIISVWAVALYLVIRMGFRRVLKDPRVWTAVVCFSVGYSNMIIDNVIYPLDSILWIGYKDYALNTHWNPLFYAKNMSAMFLELIRSLASVFPRKTGILYEMSFPILFIIVPLLLDGLRRLMKKPHGSLILYIGTFSFVFIPLVNHYFAFYISTRYIAYLFPFCYIAISFSMMRWLGKLQWNSFRKTLFGKGMAYGSISLFLFFLPIEHFYAYAGYYIETSQDNSAEYSVVKKIQTLNKQKEPIVVDQQSKQGEALQDMLRVKGYKSELAGLRPEAQFKEQVWIPVFRKFDDHAWYVLSEKHFKKLNTCYHMKWLYQFHVSNADNHPAYVVGKIKHLQVTLSSEQKRKSLCPIH